VRPSFIRVIRASGSAGARPIELPQLVLRRRGDPTLGRQPLEHRPPVFPGIAPHDRAHRRIGLDRRGIDTDPASLDQALASQQPKHQGQDGVVRLERQAGARPRQGAVVGHRLARPKPEEVAQRQAVGATPGNPALAVQALK
jgi:hypothetical protein